MSRKKLIISVLWVTLVASLNAQPQYATVLKVTGSANLKPRGTVSYNVPIKMSMGINIGDAIKTEADGFVALVFSSDKSMLKLRKKYRNRNPGRFNDPYRQS